MLLAYSFSMKKIFLSPLLAVLFFLLPGGASAVQVDILSTSNRSPITSSTESDTWSFAPTIFATFGTVNNGSGGNPNTVSGIQISRFTVTQPVTPYSVKVSVWRPAGGSAVCNLAAIAMGTNQGTSPGGPTGFSPWLPKATSVTFSGTAVQEVVIRLQSNTTGDYLWSTAVDLNIWFVSDCGGAVRLRVMEEQLSPPSSTTETTVCSSNGCSGSTTYTDRRIAYLVTSLRPETGQAWIQGPWCTDVFGIPIIDCSHDLDVGTESLRIFASSPLTSPQAQFRYRQIGTDPVLNPPDGNTGWTVGAQLSHVGVSENGLFSFQSLLGIVGGVIGDRFEVQVHVGDGLNYGAWSAGVTYTLGKSMSLTPFSTTPGAVDLFPFCVPNIAFLGMNCVLEYFLRAGNPSTWIQSTLTYTEEMVKNWHAMYPFGYVQEMVDATETGYAAGRSQACGNPDGLGAFDGVRVDVPAVVDLCAAVGNETFKKIAGWGMTLVSIGTVFFVASVIL